MEENDFCCRKLCDSSDSESQPSLSRLNSSVSDMSDNHALSSLDQLAVDADADEDSEDRFWRDPPENSVSSDVNALCSVRKSMQSDTLL